MDLIEAVKENNIQLVKELLNSSNVNVNVNINVNLEDVYTWTPLMYASHRCFVECVQIILQAGANPNFINKSYSALILALKYDNVKCVQLLLKAGANPYLKNDNVYTAFYYTYHRNNKIKKILKRMIIVNLFIPFYF
jgi:ankyrin repeat protein